MKPIIEELTNRGCNMGIAPMYETVCKIVEPFRAGNEDGVAEAYKELLKEREEYRELAAKLC